MHVICILYISYLAKSNLKLYPLCQRIMFVNFDWDTLHTHTSNSNSSGNNNSKRTNIHSFWWKTCLSDFSADCSNSILWIWMLFSECSLFHEKKRNKILNSSRCAILVQSEFFFNFSLLNVANHFKSIWVRVWAFFRDPQKSIFWTYC